MKVTFKEAKPDDPIYKTGLTVSSARSKPSTKSLPPSTGGTMQPILIETPWDDRAVEEAVDEAIASGRTKIKASRMKLSDYNGFSGDLRVQADRKIKIAIDLGLIPPPKKCSICGTAEGRIDYHNEDYGHPLRTVAICSKCHLALHNRNRSPGWAANWQKRIEAYGDGTKWFERIPRK